MLERMGYRVTTFQSAHQARAIFERDPSAYDLVITDLSMPEMDGRAFSRLVRAAKPDIPIILATGYSTALNGNGEFGVDALIDMPAHPDELAGTVRWVLDRRRA
jgi:CheY-like chemotaxis protein